MGVASVHPSQRRLSCELCRKAKSRCQRLNWNDAKCARCTMLAVDCTTGQQRNPGRPRRTAAHTSRRPTAEQPPVQLNNQPSPPTISRTDTSVWGKGIHLDWDSIMSPAATPAQLSIPAVDDQLDAASTWPTLGINSFDQYSPPWDTDFGHDQTDSFLTPDAGISITMPPQYGLETPPKPYRPPIPPASLRSILGRLQGRIQQGASTAQMSCSTCRRSTSTCTSVLRLPS